MSGRDVWCLVDSGAEVNLIGENTFRKLKTMKLSRPAKKLCSYGLEGERRELPLLGCFQERVKASQTKLATVTDVYVMKG